MKIEFLGTGTSQGIPVIGCDCEVCLSKDQKDKRLRCSILIEIDGLNLVIDTGPDFRQQMLNAGVKKIDGVLITHQHNDHIIGLDDIRPFNFRTRTNMPVYATSEVQKDLLARFSYIFAKKPYPGAPQVTLNTIVPNQKFEIKGIEIEPIPIMHGRLPIVGFRIQNFAYLTDVKTIAPQEIEALKGIDTLVISALHRIEHHSHLTLEQSLAYIEEIQPKKAYIIHLSHMMGTHKWTSEQVPAHVFVAYDGLILDNI